MTRLNERQLCILRTIAHSPRAAQHFTHGEALVASPPVIATYLDHMVQAGLIEARRDTYTITEAGTAYLASEPEIVGGTLICNASMPSGSYQPKPWNIRNGGEDHRQFSSRGIGA